MEEYNNPDNGVCSIPRNRIDNTTVSLYLAGIKGYKKYKKASVDANRTLQDAEVIIEAICEYAKQNHILIKDEDDLNKLLNCFYIQYKLPGNPIVELSCMLQSFSADDIRIKIDGHFKSLSDSAAKTLREALMEKLLSLLYKRYKIDDYTSYIEVKENVENADKLKVDGMYLYSSDNIKKLTVNADGLNKIIQTEQSLDTTKEENYYVSNLYKNLVESGFTQQLSTYIGCFIYDTLTYINILNYYMPEEKKKDRRKVGEKEYYEKKGMKDHSKPRHEIRRKKFEIIERKI
ncbi:hypothetical protein [Parabacteroides sp. PFB2-10]|uniref:hypothetical protein n=1 Tax=Parabacteroides sp. PFB2-10 TaxID=1742405 RepID=UPI002475CF2E|nr:hypothetical protein [Parabacteroides sp. PFB2-10]